MVELLGVYNAAYICRWAKRYGCGAIVVCTTGGLLGGGTTRSLNAENTGQPFYSYIVNDTKIG